MKLKKAQIRNFRSIKEIDLNLSSGCQILVGINETGKSNILRALSLLDDDVKVEDLDLRLPKGTESIDDAYVRFIFELDHEEVQMTGASVAAMLCENDRNKPLFSINATQYPCRGFIATKTEALYDVNIISEEKTPRVWGWGKNVSLISGWKKATSDQVNLRIRGTDKELPIKVGQYFWSSDYDYTESAAGDGSISDFSQKYSQKVKELVEAHKPRCIYWRYSDKNLLPSSINIDEFSTNPSINKPLQSMFLLAGIEEIGDEISRAKHQNYMIRNLLKKVANAATSHINAVWKDYKNIKIELHPNGNNIDILVTDKDIEIPFAGRSDGFKRLVTFLLMISANVHTEHEEQITNQLILFDEPEIALHPTGAQNLRDELIRIGQTNTVFYSTHSIFMVDTDRIDRHHIVAKKGEITLIERADDSGVASEEVLYNALNYSMFAVLKRKNVIFEGRTDKELFELACSALKATKKKQYQDFGRCYAFGGKDIPKMAALLKLADRDFVVISDGDKPALDKRKEVLKKDHGIIWHTLGELSGTDATTSEDFIKVNAHKRVLEKLASRWDKEPLNDMEALSTPTERIKVIEKWIKSIFPKEDIRDRLSEYKIELFSSIRRDDLEDSYNALVSNVLSDSFWSKNKSNS